MGCACRSSLGCRSPDRAGDQPVRDRGAEGAVPAGDLSWRAVVLDRDERARLGQRPGLRLDTGDACPGRLAAQRDEDLDERRLRERLVRRPLPYRRRRRRRHHGLSQLLVDLHSDGLEINPIRFLDGSSHFNEVVLNDVYVPDELVLGGIGMGWAQNTSELAFERGGPDRWLSTYLVVENWLHEHPDSAAGERGALLLGDVVARWWASAPALAVDRPQDRSRRGRPPSSRHWSRRWGPASNRTSSSASSNSSTSNHAGVGVAVRTSAGGRGPHRSVVHDPRRDDRGPALGRGEGAVGISDALRELRHRGPDPTRESRAFGEWLLERVGSRHLAA